MGYYNPTARGLTKREQYNQHKINNVLYRAVVVKNLNAISDPKIYPPEELHKIWENIKNKGAIRYIPEVNGKGNTKEDLRWLLPKNGLLLKIISDAKVRFADPGVYYLAFPFFPPTIQFPAKPGEQVWAIVETVQDNFNKIYWMCGIPAPVFVDDVNYTHNDREWLPNQVSKPFFPNGNNSPEALSLPPEMDYATIWGNAHTSGSFIAEAVPTFTKREGDLTLQGSNNSLISLGTERGWGKNERISSDNSSNAIEPTGELAAAIDIVVGRGMPQAQPGEDPTGTTGCKVIKNTRDQKENDKYFVNPLEGDPDFATDASRIYISMKSSGDQKFGLEYPDVDGVAIEPVSDAPYAVVKSNEIRIISRKDEENNGSIKIIKEGEADIDRAVITIQPDGSIMIDGPKIIIGSGLNDQVIIGNNSDKSVSDHLVRGETIVELLKTMVDILNNHVHPSAVGPTGISPTPFDQPWANALSKIGKIK